MLRLRVNCRYDLIIRLSPCGGSCEGNDWTGGFYIRLGASAPGNSWQGKRAAYILRTGQMHKQDRSSMFYEKGAAAVLILHFPEQIFCIPPRLMITKCWTRRVGLTCGYGPPMIAPIPAMVIQRTPTGGWWLDMVKDLLSATFLILSRDFL